MPQPQTAPEGHSPVPKAARARRWQKAAFAALCLAYFFLVSWDTLKAPFAADEMVALYWYFHPTPWRLLVSQFMLWIGYLRPLGGLFYLPTYLIFGLNPVPFHAFLLLLLLIGAHQMYRLARALGCADLPAAIVALIACYHFGLNNLYFNSVFVFDVLVGIFYFAALTFYARIRSSGRLLTGPQTAAFLGLYLCALNSKEMALTMPLVLLAYEYTYRSPLGWSVRGMFRWWLRGPGRVLCWAGLLNVVSIYGKAFGRYGLMKGSAYSPEYSWERVVDFQERYLGDIFYHLPRFAWPSALAIWLAVTYLVWRRNRPILRFCWFYVLLTPLPLMFLVGRDQGCLYITLAGWAVLAGTLFADWLTAAVPVVAAEPLFRRLGQHRVRVLLAGVAIAGYCLVSWRLKESQVAPVIAQLSPQTSVVLAQFRAMDPKVRPGGTVVFLDDPWPNGFDMAFIAELWFRDRKVRVILNQKTRLGQEEIDKADAVFTWQNEKLIRIR